jgi:hypothetical protein
MIATPALTLIYLNMPQTIINVYDRPTYQTEKVKGWDIVRMFKASDLTSQRNGGQFNVSQGSQIIQNFIQNYASNYKGTNQLVLNTFENFDSIRIRMNGLFYDERDIWFNFALNFFDPSYSSLINTIQSNYDQKLDDIAGSNSYKDWYLDIELTFYINDNNEYCFVVNGNYTIQFNDPRSRGDVRLVPFNGEVNLGNNAKIAIDLEPWCGTSNPYIIKSINMDFVE